MIFRDTLLYQLLKWFGAAVIGFALTIGCDMLLAKLFGYYPSSYNLINVALTALGLICMALSRIVGCPIRKFLLASIGAIFTIKYGVITIMSYSLPLIPPAMLPFLWPVIMVLFIAIAYLLLKNNVHQYLCLQAFGFYLLVITLAVGVPSCFLLMGLAQRPDYFLEGRTGVGSSIFGGLINVYIMLGLFSRLPSLIRLAFICASIFLLLLSVWLMYAFFEAGLTITLVFGVFILCGLSFIAYRLSHQKAEAA